MLSACTTNVVVEGSVPTPLVAKMPVSVGVYYSPEFKSFTHEEVIEQRGTFKIDLGKQNLTFFRKLMGSMFDSVTEVEEPPLPAGKMAGLDGILIPEIVKYGFLTPAISGLNFYSASIHYRIRLLDNDGKEVGSWTLVGYGKADTGGAFGGENALEEATLLAIRDGGARVALEIPPEPAVVAWINRHHHPKAGDASTTTGGSEE